MTLIELLFAFIWKCIITESPSELAENITNQLETSVTHDITESLYHVVGYQFYVKDYPRAEMLNSWATVTLDDDRKDRRNTIFHELGLYIGENTLIKANATAT